MAERLAWLTTEQATRDRFPAPVFLKKLTLDIW
jgi:hypothetical protein